MGWHGRIALDDGLRQTYRWFLEGNSVRSGELTA